MAETVLTSARVREATRIALAAVITFLHGRTLVPVWLLLPAIAVGLYLLAKTGIGVLRHQRQIASEHVAAAMLIAIILIAEFIADSDTDRARLDPGLIGT
jgi:Zn2+/Cd2+-exporting ATPase